MKIEYDKKIDALYIKLIDLPYSESNEIEQGVIFDYDNSRKIIGIEILDASKKVSSKIITSLIQKDHNRKLATASF